MNSMNIIMYTRIAFEMCKYLGKKPVIEFKNCRVISATLNMITCHEQQKLASIVSQVMVAFTLF